MSYTHYNSMQQWKQCPIEALFLFIPALDQDWIDVHFLEKGSAWAIETYEEENDSGGTTIVAFKLTGSFTLIQTNYGTMQPLLNAIAEGSPVTALSIHLQAPANQANAGNMWVGDQDDPGWNVSFKIAQNDLNPKLIMSVKGMFTIAAFKSTVHPPIDQNWNGGPVV